MSLAAGTKLGPYEILAAIGAGGMGEVYKARDTRLDRIVAIKVSQEKLTDRFEREARAVAALNHPRICTLHDVGPDYLIMEYVEGKPLEGRCRSTRRCDTRLRFATRSITLTAVG
jgi:serine/threonine protein kinase